MTISCFCANCFTLCFPKCITFLYNKIFFISFLNVALWSKYIKGAKYIVTEWFNYGWWAHNAIYGSCITEMHTWNLYIINQCHPINFIKFKLFIFCRSVIPGREFDKIGWFFFTLNQSILFKYFKLIFYNFQWTVFFLSLSCLLTLSTALWSDHIVKCLK